MCTKEKRQPITKKERAIVYGRAKGIVSDVWERIYRKISHGCYGMMGKGRSYGSNFFPIIITFMVYYQMKIEKARA